MKRTLIALSLMSISPLTLSQQYSGTVNDLNAIFDPPAEIQSSLCGQYDQHENRHASTVCQNGVSAARWMAEKYARKAGKYLGCLDGFYQGVWDGYMATKDPTAQMRDEAEAYLNQTTMQSAIARGEQKALESALTESADDIVQRYRDAMSQRVEGIQALPNKEPNLEKIPHFSGFSDGYVYDIESGVLPGGGFRDAIDAGYVNAGASLEDKIAARRAHALQGEYARNLCDVNQTIFGRRGMEQLTIWDFFKARRQFNFQKYGWRNGDWANDIYHKSEQTVAQHRNYEQIPNLEVTVPQTTAIKETKVKVDAEGNPISKKDAEGNPLLVDGKPQYQTEEVIVGHNTEMVRRKVNAEEIKFLRGIYNTGFKEAYNRYYAKQYASREYHEEGVDKYVVARTIGQEIGKDVAEATIKAQTYNQKYKTESRSAYDKKSKELYLENFYELVSIFENNPVVELNYVEVLGETDDQIFRRGEKIYANFSVTNLGEVSGDVNLALGAGQGLDGVTSGFIFKPAPLNESSYQSSFLGRIAPNAPLRKSLSMAFQVSNPGVINEITRELSVTKQEGITVRDYSEIKNINSNAQALDGQVGVQVTLENPSNIESPYLPVVRVVFKGIDKEVTKNAMKIGANGIVNLDINLTDIDPLAMLHRKNIEGTVYLQTANASTVIDKKSFNIKVSGESYSHNLARYFMSLLTSDSVNSGVDTKAERVSKVKAAITEQVNQHLLNRTKWKEGSSELQSTVVGALQSEYKTAELMGKMTTGAQKELDHLAKALAKNIFNRRSNKVQGKKHYLKALKMFSPSLSTRKRDHKN